MQRKSGNLTRGACFQPLTLPLCYASMCKQYGCAQWMGDFELSVNLRVVASSHFQTRRRNAGHRRQPFSHVIHCSGAEREPASPGDNQ